jgi:hypothetical protein
VDEAGHKQEYSQRAGMRRFSHPAPTRETRRRHRAAGAPGSDRSRKTVHRGVGRGWEGTLHLEDEAIALRGHPLHAANDCVKY